MDFNRWNNGAASFPDQQTHILGLTMSQSEVQISVRGKPTAVRAICVDDVELITVGKRLKIAQIRDEEYYEGDPAAHPERLVSEFKAQGGEADIFSFSQRLPDVEPRYTYPMCWDNVAAIPLTNYADWSASLSQETRRNIRLAGKRGATVSAVPFSDELVRGIEEIYNETPVRQGRRFWHYGKGFETVKQDNATFAGRSEFIGAYCGAELIGFIKMVYTGKVAGIMQILSKASHQDKRPTNALIAKAVEISAEKGISHLLYCKYVYHQGYEDALTEFKRRNKFQQVNFPRYFIPLTLKGRVAVTFKLQRGLTQLLPQPLVVALLKARNRYYESKLAEKSCSNPVAGA